MKPSFLIAAAVMLLCISAKGGAADSFEFVTIRWDGDHTYVILPNGKVDVVGRRLKTIKRPGGVDERAFYLNVTMNSLGEKGYELRGMTADGNTIVMQRRIAKTGPKETSVLSPSSMAPLRGRTASGGKSAPHSGSGRGRVSPPGLVRWPPGSRRRFLFPPGRRPNPRHPLLTAHV